MLFNLVQPIENKHQNFSIKDKPAFKISYFENKDGLMNLDSVLPQRFKLIKNSEPNFGLTNSAYWFKIIITNNTQQENLLLKISNGNITNSDFYTFKNKNTIKETINDTTKYNTRKYNTQFPIFSIVLQPDSSATFFLRIKSVDVMDLPFSIDTSAKILDEINIDQLYFGIYSGIILIMFTYNIFIYFTVKDKSYLYYVLYIIFVGVLQACLKGYAPKFLWPNNPWLIHYAPNFFIALSGIFSILFVFNFLQVKNYVPFLFYLLNLEIIVYIIGIIINLAGNQILAQQALQLNAGIVAVSILICGVIILRKNYHPALFFNLSWTFFLTGVVIYILKDRGILSFNNFTNNSILIGSSLEVGLLSFALADKINIYKKEKEQSQAQALAALEENARIIKEQNITLERKVDERTTELVAANEDIKRTLTELKEAEAQLVEAEKMASLGQLTAGIAHEINNPINFVTSNISPLRRDIDILVDAINTIESIGLSDLTVEEKEQQIEDYKEEIDLDYLKIEINHLLNGINEGATRTADIVKGLKIFSRLDEDDLKKANINDGLESTLIIANNLIGNKIKVIRNLDQNLPLIECYPGKLNQVFLNIISNAVFAINEKFYGQPGGTLKITTETTDQSLLIKIEDNGAGMSEATKKKIYEPFFTTKDVGVGTGLGMSIVYNTIKKHNGQIFLNSEEGVGTEFVIELQLVLKEFVTDYQSEQNG